jgi:hypothetical protein
MFEARETEVMPLMKLSPVALKLIAATYPTESILTQCLEVATVVDGLISPHPAHVLSCGRGSA